jgi:replicative DNA helicase Mcm
LVGKVYPGDRVVVSGVLRRYLRVRGGQKTPYYERYFDANSLELKQEAFDELDITESDTKHILELSEVPDVYDQFVKSFAPTIYGHERIKEAIVLQMFGGYSKKMPDGITVMRGDIHILLVGDPGTAKSVLLKYAKGLAPRSIYVSGKGSSEAGLTAAAVKDDFGEGRWTLEAGAMVMADKGLACVDEIDKMREETRDALHEALEQQTVSIAKAGINAQLNARASLLAAANPVLGRFSIYDPLAKQINMKPTLLSRFDLIFTFYDKPSEDTDSKMAEYILNNSLFGELTQCAASGIHLNRESKDCMDAGIAGLMPPVDKDLMRKYIAWSRQKVFPVMTKDAKAIFFEFFKKLRKSAYGDDNAPIPITARQLDALVRLGEASARTRLSSEVTADDANRVVQLVEFCLKTVFMDPESGKIDVDWVDGTAQTKKDKVRAIREIIKRLEREYGEEVPIVEIVTYAVEEGIAEDKVDEAIELMKRDGILYSPGTGVVRFVR